MQMWPAKVKKLSTHSPYSLILSLYDLTQHSLPYIVSDSVQTISYKIEPIFPLLGILREVERTCEDIENHANQADSKILSCSNQSIDQDGVALHGIKVGGDVLNVHVPFRIL